MPLFELLIDVSLVLLLVVTITYCWVLNARIRVLQDGRSELANLLAQFDASTQRASDTIAVLQTATKKSGDLMQARLDRAAYVADDINFLIDRAEKVANRLEAGVNIGRTARKVADELAASEPKPAPVRAAQRPAPPPEEIAQPDVPQEMPRGGNPLQAMIEKIAARTVSDPALRGQRAAKFPETRARSRVEQELLEIIRAGKS